MNNRYYIDRDDDIITKILELLYEPAPSRHVFFLEGEGGIGKTSILHALPSYIKQQERVSKITIVTEYSSSEWYSTNWFDEFLQGAKAQAARLDATINLKSLEDLSISMNENMDALIINLGTDLIPRNTLKGLHNNNVRIVTVDNYTEGIGSVVDAQIVQNNFDGALTSLKQLAYDINYAGDFMAIWVEEFAPLVQRTRALSEIERRHPQLNCRRVPLRDTYQLQDLQEKIREHIAKYKIEAIWIPYGKLAKEVYDILKEDDQQAIKLYSFDLDGDIYENIQDLNTFWQSTIATNPREMGQFAVQLAMLPKQLDNISKYELPMKEYAIADFDKYKGTFSWSREWYKQKYTKTLLTEKQRSFLEKLQKGNEQVSDSFNIIKIIDVDASTHKYELGIENQLCKLLGLDECDLAEPSNRAVIRIDTLEKLGESNPDPWKNLLHIMDTAQNSVFVLAGRNMDIVETAVATMDRRKEISAVIGKDFCHYEQVGALGEEVSKKYFDYKSKKYPLPSETKEYVLWYASGRPLFIDLYMSYCFQSDIDTKYPIGNRFIDALEELSIDDAKEHRKSVEKHLLEHSVYSYPDHPLGHLWRDFMYLLAYVANELDAKAIKDLLGITSDVELKDLLTYAEKETDTFMKSFVDEEYIYSSEFDNSSIMLHSFMLHDEVRRLLQAMRLNDEYGIRAYRISQAMVIVFDKRNQEYRGKINDIDLKIEQLEVETERNQFRVANLSEHEKKRLEMKRNTLKVKKDYFTGRREEATRLWLKHIFFTDVPKWFGEFNTVVRKTRRGRKSQFIFELCELTEHPLEYEREKTKQALDKLGRISKYRYDFIVARANLDIGKLEKAKSKFLLLIEELKKIDGKDTDIDTEDENPERILMESHNMLGVAYERLGLIDKALAEQDEAKKWLLDQMTKSYHGEYKVDEDIDWSLSGVYNQIGHLYHLKGKYDTARKWYKLSEERIAVFKKRLYDKRRQNKGADGKKKYHGMLERATVRLAITKSRFGYACAVDRKMPYYDDTAEAYYESALGLLANKDKERDEAKVYIHQGILFRDKGKYHKSQDVLKRAIKSFKIPDDHEEECRAHLHLGWAHWFHAYEGIEIARPLSLAEAIKSFKEGIQLAKRYNHPRQLLALYHQLASVHWAYYRWHISQANNDSQLAQNHLKEAYEYNRRALNVSEFHENEKYRLDIWAGVAECIEESSTQDLRTVSTSLQDIFRKIPRVVEVNDASTYIDYIVASEFKLEDKLGLSELFNRSYPLYVGRMLRIWGDSKLRKAIAHGNRQDVDLAFERYSKAYPLIQKHGGYGPYALKVELMRLTEQINKTAELSVEQAYDKVEELSTSWQSNPRWIHLIGWCNKSITNLDKEYEGDAL